MPSNFQTDTSAHDPLDYVLEEPILKPISDNFLRIRRNLLVISLVGILYGMGTFTIDGLSVSGIKLNCGSHKTIEIIGFLVILYQFMHFIFEAWEHYLYWRLRITGTKLAHVTTGKFAHEEGDYPNDPQQSTLYSWWVAQRKNLKGWQDIEKDTGDIFTKLGVFMSSLDTNNVRNEVVGLSNKVSGLINELTKITNILSSHRVGASLEKFDKWFWNFQKLQLLKWAVLELILPFIMGLLALYFMFPSIVMSIVKYAFMALTKTSPFS